MIGINQQIDTESGSNSGVGFAIPISAVKRSIAQLAANGKAEYAYIGVSTQPLYPQLAEKLGLDTDYGGLIAEVVPRRPRRRRRACEGGDGKIHFQGFRLRNRRRRDPLDRRPQGRAARTTSRAHHRRSTNRAKR